MCTIESSEERYGILVPRQAQFTPAAPFVFTKRFHIFVR